MTTNEQLNDTQDYHIKPTISTCNMISGFRLKGLCVAKKCLSPQSNFNYRQKVF